MTLRYLFRAPILPGIATAASAAFAITTFTQLEALIARFTNDETVIRLLDSEWEWFEYFRKHQAVAPHFPPRPPPSKKTVIDLVNERSNRHETEPLYVLRSLSSRSREEVFERLLSLLPDG